MADDIADIRLFHPNTGPEIFARCRRDPDTKNFVFTEVILGHGTAAAAIKLAGLLPSLPKDLLADNNSRLKQVIELTEDLRAAYAALRSRLSDLPFDRTTDFFGLPATARYTAKVSITLPQMTPTAVAPEIGFHADCHLEIAANGAAVRAQLDLSIRFSAALPTLSGAFGWPSFGFSFEEPDFSGFKLIGRDFALPVPTGWLPNSTIRWNASPPTLRLTLDGGLSLVIDAAGAPATGQVELGGHAIIQIAAFKIEGPVNSPKVTLDLRALADANVPDGDVTAGPLTLAWRRVTVTTVAGPAGLIITTSIGRLAISVTGKAELIVASLDLVTSYDANGGVDTRVDNPRLIEPTGTQLAAMAIRELSGLKRIIVPLTLPSLGNADVLLDRIGLLGKAVISWLGGGLDAVGGALIGLGKGAASFADWIFDCIAELDGSGAQLVLELRWDSTRGALKQIIVSRARGSVAARKFDRGELKIAFPGASQPMLVLDLVDRWMAIAVAPKAAAFEAVFSTDLWVSGASGTTAVRGNEPDPLITVSAKLEPSTGDLQPVALVLLQDGRAHFFQSLGGGPAEQIAGVLSIGAVLVPGPFNPEVSVELTINKERLTSIFPKGSGSAGQDATAPRVTVKSWNAPTGTGSIKQIDVDLEIMVGAGTSKPIQAKVAGSFDVRTLELRFGALEIPIAAPDPIDFFGARATIIPNAQDHAFVLRIDEAASIALATGARAELRFDSIGDGGDVLTFEAEGPTGLALGTSGLDLDAKVRPNPIRLPGLDTPFRFTGGALQVERGRILSAGITGSGALPPALLGEAKIDAGIQFGRKGGTGPLVVESATARLERAGEPLVCESTRFHFELTHVGLGFKLIDTKVHFYGELTGSATFRPNTGEFANGLLSRLPEIRINFERAPIAGDGRALAKSINFQIPINPPARAKLFDLFEFELRGIGFHPAYDGWADTPPTLSLSGQARMTESFDIVQMSFDAHQVYVTRPSPTGTLPRVRMDGLGIGLRIAAMGEFAATAIAVDGSLPSLFKPDILPANVTARGFLASGRLMLKGWAAMSGAAGFLELAPKDETAGIDKRLSFYIYAQQEQLSEAIPTPVGTLYLREVGFGFGFRYTLAALAQTDQLTDPRDIIRTLDPLSQKQGDLSSFPAWQPELEGNRLTLAMRALFSVTTASSASVYNAEKEKELDNPVLFDVVAALRSDLTFLLSARAWIAVNYADWLNGPKDWHEKPILRGYIYISAPKRIFLGRLIVDPKGHVGEHPKLPEPLLKALSFVESASATLYITPDLFHQELGWPYELKLKLGDPKDKFYAALSGGMVVRIEDGAVLHGIAFSAAGHVRVGGRGGGSVGASAQALATFALDGKFIAYVSVARPIDSIFYGRLSLALTLEFSIEFWVDTKFFSLSASWSEKIDVEIDLELAVSPHGIGGHARASLSLRRFGRGLRLGVSLGFKEDLVGAARGRVERFMALGLGATVPDPASGLPPLPEAARRDRAATGDMSLTKLAERRDMAPLPDSETPTDTGPASEGTAITSCDFWAIVMPIQGKREEALLHLVPRDAEPPKVQAYFGEQPHGDFFVSPIARPGVDDHRRSGGHYILAESTTTVVLAELKVPDGQVAGLPVWGAIVDAKSGATLGDLVAGGFLREVGGKLTQPRTDPSTPKEKLDTIGCIEARGALIGHVAEQARLLAENWTDAPGNGAPTDFDPRWFGLTFRIGGDGSTLKQVLAKLFPPNSDPAKPRPAAFKIAKSDVDGPPEFRTVELFNPIERWFENAQPRLAQPRSYMSDQTIRLAWDLEPRWGASQGRYDDPEYHLMHYAIQRHIIVAWDQSRRFHASWLAKGAETVDVLGDPRPRDHQLIDRLDNLPDALRKALLLMLSKNSGNIDVLQQEAHHDACAAWSDAFGALEFDSGRGDGSMTRASVTLVYGVVPIDNSGTRGDPSPPITLRILAPLAEREKPFGQVNLSFDYLTQTRTQFTFPRSIKDRPSRMTVAISKRDLPERRAASNSTPRSRKRNAAPATALPPIEMFLDVADEVRSGIFGADLLDADRHRNRIISPDKPVSALLSPGKGPAGSIAVDLLVIDPDQNDPTIVPEAQTYHCPRAMFETLVGSPRRATQIYARWQSEKGRRPAPWTRCDLKLRISRFQSSTPTFGPRYDDFLAPIAEFEQPLLSPHLLLPEGAITAEQGILYRTTPAANAVLGEDPPEILLPRDPKNRKAIRLSWTARPQHYCDGSQAKPDHIGGFDLFVASRDRETETVLTAADRARLALPLGRVLVKPQALLNSEPAQIEDFSRLEVSYPSAGSIARGRGWYSAAESRLIWPKPVPRRSLMLIPDEGLIGEIFSCGVPTDLRLRLESIESEPATLILDLAALDSANELPPAAAAELLAEVDGWRPVKFAGARSPTALRELMQRLIWAFADTQQPLRAVLKIVYRSGNKDHGHEVEVGLGSETHPILADLLELLRYDREDFAKANGYRRYEPVVEGAPPPGSDRTEATKGSVQKPLFAQLLSDTAGESDKAGWAALRQLGLAVGFRLWDTETSDWVNPGEHRDNLLWAWRQAIARCSFAPGDIGAPFLEQFYDPEELFVLGGEDLLREPQRRNPEGMPLLQASLRPIADRLLNRDRDGARTFSVHYLSISVDGGAIVRASEIDKEFEDIAPNLQGRAFVQLLLRSPDGRPGGSVWVGSPVEGANGFQADKDYVFGSGDHQLLARIVLAGAPVHSETVAGRLRRAIANASDTTLRIRVAPLDWSPADHEDAPDSNPYLRFEAVPAELAVLTEHVPTDGRHRLKLLAARRFEVPALTGADEALALQRWEKRFFDLGVGARLDAKPAIGVAFATMDAPASLRRAPNHRGEIRILYFDESQLGSWRRFYVRPFGRYDHLAEASGWLEPIEGRLHSDDFGPAPAPDARPWVDVALARSREVPKPVLLASAYSADAKALVLVAARADHDVLAGANVPQAGAAQVGAVDIGFDYALDEPRRAWATAHLATWEVMPKLTAVPLDPPDAEAFVRWLLGRATPPKGTRRVPAPALPDLWRGATAVAAYDLPYFFTYSAQLSANAGTETSVASDAAMPSPQPVDFALGRAPVWVPDGGDVIIRLPLARFVDCMDPDSRATWYQPGGPSAPLFELPDPAIVYRIYLRSPQGDMWSSEIDVEAEPDRASYAAHVTGQTFGTGHCEPPVKQGEVWSLTLRVTTHDFDAAAASALVVIPVRQTHSMTAIKIERAL